jgi:hypothetical protein
MFLSSYSNRKCPSHPVAPHTKYDCYRNGAPRTSKGCRDQTSNRICSSTTQFGSMLQKQNILKTIKGLRDYFPFLVQQLLANLCTQN